MREQHALGSADRRKIVIWSGLIAAILSAGAALMLFEATWLEALGIGMLFGLACALGAGRGVKRLPRRN
jgi:type IV secretory pathway TrbD component